MSSLLSDTWGSNCDRVRIATCSPPGKFRRLGTTMHLADREHLAKQLCTVAIFGLRLASVLDRAEVDRDLDLLELWSGVGSIVRAGSRRPYNARGFDNKNSEYEDITTPAGFKHAVNLVLQLVVGGLLWMAPVCSSFTFMNSSNCMRGPSNNYYGDTNCPSMIEGNLMHA